MRPWTRVSVTADRHAAVGGAAGSGDATADRDAVPVGDAALSTSALSVVPGAGAMAGLVAAARTPAGAAGLTLTALAIGTALLAPLLAPADPFAITGPSLAPPTPAHPLGTDALGRDLASGMLYGARTSLMIAAAVGAIACVLGTGVGVIAGYVGGRLDDALMRLTELFQVLPRFFLAAVAMALLGPGLDRLVLILGITSWPMLARVVRTETLSLRRLEFVRAAEAIGASGTRVMVRELLPNVLPSVLVMLGLLLGQVLLLEASLGFIGLGDPGAMSWGTLAGQAQPFLRVAWWLPLFPGLAITLTVLGLNLLSDALARSVSRS
jgi:peptide/nickel transport system permease protein